MMTAGVWAVAMEAMMEVMVMMTSVEGEAEE